jgi:hypothetical protein
MKAEHRRPLIAFLLVTVVCFAMMVHAIRTDALGGFARLDPARVVAGQLLVPKPTERPAAQAVVEPPVLVSSGATPVESEAGQPSPSFSGGASAPAGHESHSQGSDGKVGGLSGGLVGGAVGDVGQPAGEPGDDPTGEAPSSPPSSTATPGHGPWGEGRPGAVGAPPATPATPATPSAPSTPSTPAVPSILDQAIELLGGRHDHGHHDHERHDDGRHDDGRHDDGPSWGHSDDDHDRDHGRDRDHGHDRDRDRDHDRGHGWGH